MFVFCKTCCQRGFDVGANDEKVTIIGLVPEGRLRDLCHGHSVKKQNDLCEWTSNGQLLVIG